MGLINLLKFAGVDPGEDRRNRKALERQKQLSAFNTDENLRQAREMQEANDKRQWRAFFEEGLSKGQAPADAEQYAEQNTRSAITSPLFASNATNRATGLQQGNQATQFETERDLGLPTERAFASQGKIAAERAADRTREKQASQDYIYQTLRDPGMQATAFNKGNELTATEAQKTIELFPEMSKAMAARLAEETNRGMFGAEMWKNRDPKVSALSQNARELTEGLTAQNEEARLDAIRGNAEYYPSEIEARVAQNKLGSVRPEMMEFEQMLRSRFDKAALEPLPRDFLSLDPAYQKSIMQQRQLIQQFRDEFERQNPQLYKRFQPTQSQTQIPSAFSAPAGSQVQGLAPVISPNARTNNIPRFNKRELEQKQR